MALVRELRTGWCMVFDTPDGPVRVCVQKTGGARAKILLDAQKSIRARHEVAPAPQGDRPPHGEKAPSR